MAASIMVRMKMCSPVEGRSMLFQLADAGRLLRAGQLGQPDRLRPGDDGFQHGPAGDPVDVGDHAGQLQVRVFEQHPTRCISAVRAWVTVRR